MKNAHRLSLALPGLAVLATLAGCERPPVVSVQHGYRGTGMVEIYNPRILADQAANNVVPPVQPPASQDGPRASQVFKNVQVLGDQSVGEFTRTMAAMTQWVSPVQGCTYCHNPQNFADDTIYTKVVARRMLQMTRHINADWKQHVAATGVTCYTCHRGNNIPAATWFTAPSQNPRSMVGNRAGQNAPAISVGYASLPNDPFTLYLSGSNEIRVAGITALQSGNRQSIKQTEASYGLMMHMSHSLGVNCTYCHSSPAFANWTQSTPQRVTAWYGIRMARDINNAYLLPLTSTFPATRLGPSGDVAKVNCASCHQGAFKPLYGQSMLKDYPALLGHPTGAPDAAPGAASAALDNAAVSQPSASAPTQSASANASLQASAR
jgi:photosynthetic reaction center cytochrome c subunit